MCRKLLILAGLAVHSIVNKTQQHSGASKNLFKTTPIIQLPYAEVRTPQNLININEIKPKHSHIKRESNRLSDSSRQAMQVVKSVISM
jgi:hypothetical protein